MTAEEVRETRMRAGLTQTQFAGAVGVSQQFVSAWERDEKPVSRERETDIYELDPDLGVEPGLVAARELSAPRGPYGRREESG